MKKSQVWNKIKEWSLERELQHRLRIAEDVRVELQEAQYKAMQARLNLAAHRRKHKL